MPALATLYEPIADELRRVCRVFDDELFSDLPFVNELCARVRQYRGKMLRPALLLLAGRACGQVREEHVTLAAVVELVHMATLVHDDVLDEADVRRNGATINRLEGNEAAVLLGDYLISHAFHLCSSLDSQYASRLIGATTNTVCEGELLQVHRRGDDGLTTEQYLAIITRKTAALTGACCRLGAHYAGADANTVEALERYGLDVGIAFQITDDVLDIVGAEERMGKTLGRDLDKHKLTLPVIHGLRTAAPAARQRLRDYLAEEHPLRERLAELLEPTDSIGYALESARAYVESAVEALRVLPPSDARESLTRMARLILEREQ
ncbi:MAG: polyprenyl synthetase family protein [Phycisphaerae bacterium]|jgi:octaprenyl-diphosphate synthase